MPHLCGTPTHGGHCVASLFCAWIYRNLVARLTGDLAWLVPMVLGAQQPAQDRSPYELCH